MRPWFAQSSHCIARALLLSIRNYVSYSARRFGHCIVLYHALYQSIVPGYCTARADPYLTRARGAWYCVVHGTVPGIAPVSPRVVQYRAHAARAIQYRARARRAPTGTNR